MKFVDAKCPNCGAVLKVDDSKEAAICEHCGSAFIVEKAIQQFNITNVTNNNINAQTVNVYTKGSDFTIIAGTLTKYCGESSIVKVPNNVSKIAKGAFPFSVTEVYLPDSITSIDPEAFSRRSATEKEAVYISKYKNYFFPDLNVQKGIFELKKIHMSANIKQIPNGLFSLALYLQSITIQSGTEKIGNACFEGCVNLREIALGNSISIIGSDAFRGCNLLKEVNLPASITQIGISAFAYSGIMQINIPKNVILGDRAFEHCKNLTTVNIAEGIKGLSNTFVGDSKLAKINIPHSVEVITYAFKYCTSLTKIFIPNNVKIISDLTFPDCQNLTIYCERKKPFWGQPQGWSEFWTEGCKKVIWNVSEEEYNKLP